MAKTLLSWTEPAFFVLRLRTRREWLLRGAWVAGIAATSFAGLHFLGQGVRDWLLDLEVGLVIGLVLTFVFDLAYWHREVWLTETTLEWDANAGKVSFHGAHPFADVHHIDIFRAGEWPFKFGGVNLILNNGEGFVFAVPLDKKLETIATILTRHGNTVNLSGWVPTTADTRTRVEEELVLGDPASVTRDAVFHVLPPEEPRLVPANGRVIAAIIGVFPLLLALIAMIGSWVYLGLYWNQLDLLARCLVGIGGVAVFILGFLYIMVIGQFIESALLLSMSRKNLRTRLNPVVDVDGTDVFPVSINPRENWTKVATMSPDFGYLQVDQRKSAVVFEGNKERWVIPITALTAIRIEEAEVGKEGQSGTEIRYFVVIGAHRDGVEWEVGLTRTRTEWGFDGADARRQRMGKLFEDIRTAIAVG